MKKMLFLVAVATLFFAACQQEINPDQQIKTTDKFTFKAAIEQLADLDTKGTINASNQLVWATGDKIGLYVPGWGDNQPFTLVGDGGTTEGEFSWDNKTPENSFADNASAAFYPWQGTGSSNNNVYSGTMYFKLRDSYYSYESGKMLTPLIASLENSSSFIHFKHAGAAVKVTINNVPKRVHSIGMSVDGQQISGSYSINPANAGTDALALAEAANLSNNTVWLNIWNGAQAAWDFIFPVPELTKPKLSFQMYDENNILVWSKNLKAQSSDLHRGDILVFDPLTITPYSQFTESAEWTLCGKIGGITAWDADIPMYTDGTVTILKGISFKAGDEFKIRKNKAWDEAYPGSNYAIDADCTKDVWFNNSTHEITLKDAKCDYPAPKVTLYFGINGAIPKSIHISSSTLAPGAEWPGLELTEREYINGKWYYKHVVDGTTVWGNSISGVYIVSKDSWNTSSSTINFNTIKTEYYFEATASTAIEQLSERPADAGASGITIDGDMSDWTSILPLGSSGTSRIRDWKFSSDETNLYFFLNLRKNKMRTAYSLTLIFDWDESGSYGGDNLSGGEASVVFQPFSNDAAGTPTVITTVINTATINGSGVANAGIYAYGYDPDSSAADDNADYYLEISIPKASVPSLPSSGSINIGAGYEWYNTSLKSVTL